MATAPGHALAPDGRSVIVTFTAGEPETGLWCGTCLLPSVIRIPFLIGGKVISTAEACAGCDEEGRRVQA
jgi:hypothetical protein